jgi:hypothetical protein
MAAGGGIGNITIVVHELYLFSNDNTESVKEIIRQRQDQLLSYLLNVTVIEFSIVQSNFSDLYGVPNPNATTNASDEVEITRRRLQTADVIVPPLPEGCVRVNSTVVIATAEVVVPYDEHSTAYGIMRYMNASQLQFLTEQSSVVTVCSRDTSFTDRVLIPAPSPPPPEPPVPSPPDDFNPPPAPPYLWTTGIAAPGAYMSTGLFFLFCCCCIAVAGRRAGGMRNKYWGTHGMAVFPPDDAYEQDYQTRNHGFRGLLRHDGELQPAVGRRVDTAARATARKRDGQGREITFTFGIGPA